MNELLFLIHVILITFFALAALRVGKEALIVWVVLQAILANLFVTKQIQLLHFEVTCSDVFAIGSLLGLNLLQQYFGKAETKKAISLCFLSMLFFALMSQLHLWYEPSKHDMTQPAFNQLLSPAPRLFFASLAVFFIVQQLDSRLFGWLKARFPKLPLPLCNLLSLSSSQLLDTTLFTLIGLYGLVASLTDVIVLSFLIKFVIILGSSSIMTLSKRVVAR